MSCWVKEDTPEQRVALQTLQRIVTAQEWADFVASGKQHLWHRGKSYIYCFRPSDAANASILYDLNDGSLKNILCFVLRGAYGTDTSGQRTYPPSRTADNVRGFIMFPIYDKLIAEYLYVRSCENEYLNTGLAAYARGDEPKKPPAHYINPPVLETLKKKTLSLAKARAAKPKPKLRKERIERHIPYWQFDPLGRVVLNQKPKYNPARLQKILLGGKRGGR